VTAVRILWYRMQGVAAWALSLVVAMVPPPVLVGLARAVARVAFLVWRRRRQIAVDNVLRAGLTPTVAGARAIALSAFQTFAVMVVESAIMRRRMTRENWREYVELDASREVEHSLRQPGQGLIVASAHLGNWEVAARAASMLKPMCAIYRPFTNPYLDRVVRAQREGEGLRLVSRRADSPLRFVGALAHGEIVALMIDQHVVRGRVAVQFFGRPAWATKSVAMLHLTTRAPVLVACAVRVRSLRYALRVVGPVTCERTGDREKDARALTQALTAEIEAEVRRHPEQYMWGHRRWRVRGGPTS
jgi:Kdo2-lipid IVA lauroyltransferase/acyltransferase